MYELFFGFREAPFALSPNPRCLVPTNGHREAISNIEYAIATRKGITLVTGEPGSGKTTVIRTAIERQPSPVHCVHLRNPALTRTEFIEMMAESFGLSLRAQQSKTALLIELEQQITARHAAGETTVLIVDEAQSASRVLLEEFRLLANIETNDEKLLPVILVGQPELARRLDEPGLSQLKQRIALACELRPLTETETAGYILSRIRWAGGRASDTFTQEAVQTMHRLSRGIPRTINVLADNALISGVALGQRPVGRQIVEDVAQELRLYQRTRARVKGWSETPYEPMSTAVFAPSAGSEREAPRAPAPEPPETFHNESVLSKLKAQFQAPRRPL